MNKTLSLKITFCMILSLCTSAVKAMDTDKISISGISSGAFMASQMSVIYSDKFNAVASLAGGSYYCAQNHMQEKREEGAYTFGDASLFLVEPTKQFYDDTFNPFAIFQLNRSAQWFFPSVANPLYKALSCMKDVNGDQTPKKFAEEFEKRGLVSPLENIKNQKIVIYQGSSDKVVTPSNADHLVDFYADLGVTPSNVLKVTSAGGHNFPTDKKGLSTCDSQEVPYVSSCDLDFAGIMFNHFFGAKITRESFNKDHLYMLAQPEVPASLAPYAYFYANDKCLKNPGSCHLHVALHGCEMSDSFDESFQKNYEAQVQLTKLLRVGSLKSIFGGAPSLLLIEERQNKMGLLKFAMQSGLADYAEANDLMILFPQTWISEKNFPYNPKGCWDWFGFTGSTYATKEGAETKWLMDYIENVKKDPSSFLLDEKPHYDELE